MYTLWWSFGISAQLYMMYFGNNAERVIFRSYSPGNNICISRYATSRQCQNRCFTCILNLSPMHMTCVGNVDSAANGAKIVCEATLASKTVLAQTLKHGMLGVRWTSDHYSIVGHMSQRGALKHKWTFIDNEKAIQLFKSVYMHFSSCWVPTYHGSMISDMEWHERSHPLFSLILSIRYFRIATADCIDRFGV